MTVLLPSERTRWDTLHCPLLPGTRNMLAMREFEQMRNKPLIIKCGRGGLVNESDLVKALNLNLIAGIGVDRLAVCGKT